MKGKSYRWNSQLVTLFEQNEFDFHNFIRRLKILK